MIPGGKAFLPDGTPLILTISRKVVLGALFDQHETDENGEPTGKVTPWQGPANPMEDLVLLFICAVPPEVWYQPCLRADGAAVMLYQCAPAFMAEAMAWADQSCLKDMKVSDLYPVARELWYGAHDTQAIPLDTEKKTPPGETETPESPLTGHTNSPPSSPEETPAS